nr:lycopene beta-cyclase CrtY [Sphingomonas flavalba]
MVGCGPAAGLIAYALHVRRPELAVALVPGGADDSDGVHSCFANDIAAADRWIVEPFVTRSWNGYSVVFPAHRRALGVRLLAVAGGDFAVALGRMLPAEARIESWAARVSATQVALADGGLIEAGGVIDARGTGDLSLLGIGWRTGLTRAVRTPGPHGVAAPVIVDAAVDQRDGCHLVTVLPISADRLHIADSRYQIDRIADRGAHAEGLDAYLAANGWAGAATEWESHGATPVPLDGDFDAYWQSGGAGTAKAGVGAALFHPATGRLLPDAVRLAAWVADAGALPGPALHTALHAHALRTWEARRPYRQIAALLFRGAADAERYRIIEHFYRQPAGLIERFHAARSTRIDRLRILAGRTPFGGKTR